MQKGRLIDMMERRSNYSAENMRDIDLLVEKFPYCATFQILKAIGLKEQDDIRFKEQLNLAAVYAADRTIIYDYLIRENAVSATPEIGLNSDIAEIPIQSVDAATTTQNEYSAEADEQIAAPIKKDEISISENALSSEPLEAEILRAAMVHLGEMEAGFALENEVTKSAPPPRPPMEMSSFGAWLMQIDKKSGSEGIPAEVNVLLDNFIATSPQITPVKKDFFSPAKMGKLSLIEDEHLVSETLARIYERQGDHKKAAKAYENLGLKYPEKSFYFAALKKQAEENAKK